jgi:hypothetical protein
MPGERPPLPPPGGVDGGAVVLGMPAPPMPGEDPQGAGVAGEAAAVDGAPGVAVADPSVPEETFEVPGLEETPPGAAPPDVPPSLSEVFTGGEVTFRRVILCKGVKDREPVEPTSTFRREREGQIWVYLDAVNAGQADQNVTVTFEAVDRPGAAAPPVDLKIGTGARWRTWAWATTWRSPGRYRVVVRDAEGRVLARAPFEVVE